MSPTPRLVLLAIILLAVTLRLLALDARSLWIDEAFSLWLAQQPAPRIMAESARLDQHPPLYYLLLRLARSVLGQSEFALRLPSTLAGIASVPLLYASGVRLHSQRAGLIAALLLALSPLHLRYAQEARMYAPLALAVAASLYCFVRLGSTSTVRAKAFSALGLLFSTAAALYLHNVSVLWLAALGMAALVVFPRSSSRGPWLLVTLFAAGALWLPWLPTFLAQAAAVDARFWIPPPTPQRILSTLGELALVVPGAWGTPRWLLPVLALALCLPLAMLALRPFFRYHPAQRLALLFALPLLLALLISLRRSIFSTHALLWLALPLLLLVATGAATLARRWRYATTAVLCTLALLSLAHEFTASPREAWDQAAGHVADSAQPGDLLLFHAGWSQLPFAYYFDQLNAPSVESYSLPDGLFARNEIEPLFTADDLSRLHAQIAGCKRIWLIHSHVWYSDPDDLVLHTLQQHLTLNHHQPFPGVDLYLFEQP